MNKVSNFLKEVTARFKGDANEVVAAQNERKANSAVKGQLAALNAKLVDDESNVEDKTENYKNTLYPTSKITDNSYYIRSVVAAKSSLDDAKAALESTKASIKFFEELLASEWETSV